MKRKNEMLKKKINKLSYNQKFEIYNILVKSNQKFSENKNGIFFNLKYLNQSTIESIQEYLNYSDKIKNTYAHDKKNIQNTSNNEQLLNIQYNKYNETIQDTIRENIHETDKNTLEIEEFTLYNNCEYSSMSSKNVHNGTEDDTIGNTLNEDEIDEEEVVDIDEEADTEVHELYNEAVHENINDQDNPEDENENIPGEYEIEEDIEMSDFVEKDSTKNKFNFKNYMNKLQLQSKEMNVSLYKQSKQHVSDLMIHTILETSKINNKLTGSKSRIYNICKNIHKSSE